MKVMAGDIGGTSTRLAMFETDGSRRKLVCEKSFSSSAHTSFYDVIDLFSKGCNSAEPLAAACFAVAGPVQGDSCSVTNLPWEISSEELRGRLGTQRVELLNDFAAIVHGLDSLGDKDIRVLQQGETSSAGNIDAVIVGAGTGFGVAHMKRTNGVVRAYASEAGHAGFAPADEFQTSLLQWLQKQHRHVSVEMLLSGRGLHTIYRYLCMTADEQACAGISAMMEDRDPAQVIADNAANNALCRQALECFVEIYGSAAGDVALHFYPLGELYIAGGIAPKIIDSELARRFIKAFVSKGPMTANLGRLPVRLIRQEQVGLYGAMARAERLCASEQ